MVRWQKGLESYAGFVEVLLQQFRKLNFWDKTLLGLDLKIAV